MKIAVISDLHLLHWTHRVRHLNDPMPHKVVGDSVKLHKPDLIIDAGDIELPGLLLHEIGDIPLLTLAGNHDYYGKVWGGPLDEVRVTECGGLRIALTTLWMDMNGHDDEIAGVVRSFLNDFTHIRGFTTLDAYAANCAQRAWLRKTLAEQKIDIVVTHHLPSFKSVNDRYKNNKSPEEFMINYGFASHLDGLVENSGAKLWIHGHTHIPCDYMLGNTRVLCNPCGYPGEGQQAYAPVYVEI